MVNHGRLVVLLFAVACTHCVLACTPAKGCAKPDQLCVRVNSLMSKCAAVSGFHTFCDVNHKGNCAEGDACDLESGKCFHADRCNPACTAPTVCKKVWKDSQSKYKCAAHGDCGGCDTGYKCMFGRMCLQLPGIFGDLVNIMTFVVEGSADLLAGFFTGKVVPAKNAGSAAAGDMIQLTDEQETTFKSKDNQTIDARAATAKNGKLAVQSSGASASDVAATSVDPDKYDNADNYNPESLPLTDEQVQAAADTSTQRFIHLHARRVRRQDFGTGLKNLFFGLYKVAFQLTMAAFDSVIIAFDAACSIVNKCQMPVDSTLKLGGSGGPLSQMAPKQALHLQDYYPPPGQVQLPRKFMGDGVRDGSANIDFMGALALTHDQSYAFSEHSLGAASVTLDSEVSIEKHTRVSHCGTITATDSMAYFRVKSNAMMRYSGDQFAAGLRIEDMGMTTVTTKATQMSSVSLSSGGLLRVQTHHLAQMPLSDVEDGMQTAALNDSSAVVVANLDECADGARVVFSLRGGELSNLDMLQGYVMRFATPMNDTNIIQVGCNVTLEDSANNTYTFYTDPLPADMSWVQSDDYSSSSTAAASTSALRARKLRTQSVLRPRQRLAKLMHFEWLNKRHDLPQAHHLELMRLREWRAHKATRLALMEDVDDFYPAGYAAISPGGLSVTLVNTVAKLEQMSTNGDEEVLPAAGAAKSGGTGVIAAVAVIMIVAAAGGGLYYYKKKQPKEMPSSSSPKEHAAPSVAVNVPETELTAPAAKLAPPSPSTVRPTSPSNSARRTPSPGPAANRTSSAASPTNRTSSAQKPTGRTSSGKHHK